MINKILVSLFISMSCLNLFADSPDASVANNTVKQSVNVSNNATLGVSKLEIKKNAPQEYVVKKTDSVSKIATMYLKKLSLWPQFLGVSKLTATKLYPGDRLKMVSVANNQYMLVVALAGKKGNYYQRLSPEVRTVDLETQTPIPTARIKTMLLNPLVLDDTDVNNLPIVVGGDKVGGLYYTLGDSVYVKNYNGAIGDKVMVINKFRDLTDPDTNEKLGTEYRYNADGVMTQISTVSNLELTKVIYPVVPLDHVAPAVTIMPPEIIPQRSEYLLDGKIIAMYDSLTSTGENNSVVINKGIRDGVKVGTVFNITDGHSFLDPTASNDDPKYLVAPEVSIGELLVYKTYDKVSFALVTDSVKEIPLYARIKSQ